MAVAYDNGAVNSATLFGGTSVSTATFTISGTNRVGIVGVQSNENTAPSSITLSGVTATSIPSTSLFSATRGELFLAIAPGSGASKSATVNWGSAVTADIMAMTFTNADQTTGANHGNTVASAFTTTRSLAITSTSGDLTTTMFCVGGGSGVSGTPSNQTNRLLLLSFGNTDTGPGTGTTTHVWTEGSNDNMFVVGCNIIQASTSFIPGHSRPFPYAPGAPNRR